MTGIRSPSFLSSLVRRQTNRQVDRLFPRGNLRTYSQLGKGWVGPEEEMALTWQHLGEWRQRPGSAAQAPVSDVGGSQHGCSGSCAEPWEQMSVLRNRLCNVSLWEEAQGSLTSVTPKERVRNRMSSLYACFTHTSFPLKNIVMNAQQNVLQFTFFSKRFQRSHVTARTFLSLLSPHPGEALHVTSDIGPSEHGPALRFESMWLRHK